jgi:hypothetical protein
VRSSRLLIVVIVICLVCLFLAGRQRHRLSLIVP